MERSAYIQSLDGLRGLAAFAVVLSHLSLMLGVGIPGLHIGDESVALFFALSGFLMAHLYGSKAFTREAVSDYLVHRFVRIYPVYLVAILFVIFLSYLPGFTYAQPITGAVQIVRHLAMIGSTGVFWSVPPEIQFYLFFLLLWLCFEHPGRRQGLIAALLVGFVVAQHLGFPGPGIVLLSKIPYFLFGALAGRLFSTGWFRPNTASAGLAALGLIAFFFLAKNVFVSPGPFWGTSTALIATIIVYLTACEAPIARAVLSSPPLRFAGKISFSLYLFHMPIGYLTMAALPEGVPGWLRAVLFLAASLGVATLSYHAIEKPSRHLLLSLWKNRLRQRPAGPASAAVPGSQGLSS
ncbi:acyltransferase [Rhizobium sp. CG5]|uniref:acyltransferase family protein n=1 Tax=Rhizobium sp. CG5 TaxID=2726076 RepID=UPI002034050C|nr:acyltransferase [Rhizobium sp. CG5]MCM2476844.1 acyltransferase [Rhizobium sp. CG5]